MFVSFQSWLRISVARKPFTLAETRVVAQAKLRIATDTQIKGRLGLTRSVAKSVLEQALRKAEKGTRLIRSAVVDEQCVRRQKGYITTELVASEAIKLFEQGGAIVLNSCRLVLLGLRVARYAHGDEAKDDVLELADLA